MTTAQINARIEPHLKESGDFGLLQAGYTPTKAIRALWRYAAENARNQEALAQLFGLLEGKRTQSDSREAAEQRAKQAREGSLIFDSALAEMGLSAARLAHLDDEELLEQAYLEKMAERGVAS